MALLDAVELGTALSMNSHRATRQQILDSIDSAISRYEDEMFERMDKEIHIVRRSRAAIFGENPGAIAEVMKSALKQP